MKLSEFLDVSMGTFHIIEIEDDNSMVIVDDTHYLADMYNDYEVKAVYPEYFEHGFMDNNCNQCGFKICAKRNVQTVSEAEDCEIDETKDSDDYEPVDREFWE